MTPDPVTPKAQMSDEEFVRRHIAGDVKAWNDFVIAEDFWKVQALWVHGIPSALGVFVCLHGDELMAWAAAAEFTRERLEQIRQIREEIALLEIARENAAGELFFSPLMWSQGQLARTIRTARWSRILMARQDALTELKRGMSHE